jgi:pilus assembly protein Flp/PilA
MGEHEMKSILGRFAKDNSGVTAVEYGLIAGLIGVVIIGALTTVGTKVSAKFQAVATALT